MVFLWDKVMIYFLYLHKCMIVSIHFNYLLLFKDEYDMDVQCMKISKSNLCWLGIYFLFSRVGHSPSVNPPAQKNRFAGVGSWWAAPTDTFPRGKWGFQAAMRKAGVGAILITKNEILPISKNPFRTRASSMPVQSFPLYLYRR